MSELTIIGHHHPQDDQEWDCQCARCGSSLGFASCDSCAGEGWTAPGELFEENPLWYDEEDTMPCPSCYGFGGWHFCLSSPEWCQANPLPGREEEPSGRPEWFVIEGKVGK